MSERRVHQALTASLEKRVLVWIATRLPVAITPDHLTVLAFVSQLLAGATYAMAQRDARALLVVDFFIFLNWLGDSLDGTLARVRNRQRPRYGFYVDHMADTLGAFALMLGLAASGFAHWQIAAALLGCFYVVSIETYLTTHTLGYFQLSHGIFGPTEIRVLLCAANAVAVVHSRTYIAGRSFLLFDVGGAVAIGGMAWMALAATFRHIVLLYRAETAP